MVIVNIYHFDDHICRMVCVDYKHVAFNLVSFKCVNKDLGLWVHATKPGFYALSFSE